MSRAFTRAVSPRIAECQLTHLDRVAIDAAKAAWQHSAYEAALAQAGLAIVRLPDLPDDPDAVFVEDTALLLGDHAIITRPGVASRAGETKSTAAVLSAYFELHSIERGHVDGGDVLLIGRTLYVGASTRTDAEGISALGELAATIGYSVVRAELGDCLHLKTAATFIGSDGAGTPVLLFDPRAVDPVQFTGVETIAVAENEPAAANSLRAANSLIVTAGCPRTAGLLDRRGFALIEVDVSELHKAEAGLTWMSLIDHRD